MNVRTQISWSLTTSSTVRCSCSSALYAGRGMPPILPHSLIWDWVLSCALRSAVFKHTSSELQWGKSLRFVSLTKECTDVFSAPFIILFKHSGVRLWSNRCTSSLICRRFSRYNLSNHISLTCTSYFQEVLKRKAVLITVITACPTVRLLSDKLSLLFFHFNKGK